MCTCVRACVCMHVCAHTVCDGYRGDETKGVGQMFSPSHQCVPTPAPSPPLGSLYTQSGWSGNIFHFLVAQLGWAELGLSLGLRLGEGVSSGAGNSKPSWSWIFPPQDKLLPCHFAKHHADPAYRKQMCTEAIWPKSTGAHSLERGGGAGTPTEGRGSQPLAGSCWDACGNAVSRAEPESLHF